MRLFRKRRRGNRIAENGLITQLNQSIGKQQRKFADYLGRKTQYWNRASKIIALVIFCLLFGSFCLLLFIKAIIHF
jgi:hypothetical protein